MLSGKIVVMMVVEHVYTWIHLCLFILFLVLYNICHPSTKKNDGTPRFCHGPTGNWQVGGIPSSSVVLAERLLSAKSPGEATRRGSLWSDLAVGQNQ